MHPNLPKIGLCIWKHWQCYVIESSVGLSHSCKTAGPWLLLSQVISPFVFVASNLHSWGNVSLWEKEQAWLLLAIKMWIPQAQWSSGVMLSMCLSHFVLPPWNLGARLVDAHEDIHTAYRALRNKHLASGPETSYLLAASMKQ